MKILIITPYFYPRIGGLENYAYNISKILVNKYHIDLSIICSNWEKNVYLEEIIDGIKIYRLPYLFKVSSTPINPFWAKKINDIINQEKPDIINGHVPVPYIADIGARIAHKKGIPFVLTYQNDLVGYNIQTDLLSKMYYRVLGNKTFNLSTLIIVTSKYYAKKSIYLRKHCNKIKIIPPGVDTEKYYVSRSDYIKDIYGLKREKVILFVGQLNKESQHKGLEYLLKATAIVNRSVDTFLIVVGKGNFTEHYKIRADALKISEKIIFAGFVDDCNISKYYNGADVVILPSYNRAEGFGMVLIEAQACGTPVIGSKVGGIPYVIKDGETGLLVPPKDSEQLADAIIKILCDDELSHKMVALANERVRTEFTWTASTKKFLDILNGIYNE